MIRLGVVGCGWVAESVHLPVLRGLSGIEVHAACDTSDERLQHIRRRFGIARLHRTWPDLVADTAIDAVLVATPADQHAAIARGAVIAGKHVLVEKPLSLTLPEAQAVAAVARDSGLVTMVGLNFRFHPLVRRLRDAIARGDLGRPVATFVTLASMRDQRRSVTGYETQPHLGGGVFHDKVVHLLDVLRFLFDGEVVTAQATGRPGTPRHEFTSLRLEMDSGVLVSGICGDQMFPDFTCLVLGDAGKAMINLTRPTGLLLYRKAFVRHRMLRLSGYARQMLQIASTVSYFATARGRLSSYRAQWETFRQGVSTRIPPRPNFDDGVAITRTLQQLLASAETP